MFTNHVIGLMNQPQDQWGLLYQDKHLVMVNTKCANTIVDIKDLLIKTFPKIWAQAQSSSHVPAGYEDLPEPSTDPNPTPLLHRFLSLVEDAITSSPPPPILISLLTVTFAPLVDNKIPVMTELTSIKVFSTQIQQPNHDHPSPFSLLRIDTSNTKTNSHPLNLPTTVSVGHCADFVQMHFGVFLDLSLYKARCKQNTILGCGDTLSTHMLIMQFITESGIAMGRSFEVPFSYSSIHTQCVIGRAFTVVPPTNTNPINLKAATKRFTPTRKKLQWHDTSFISVALNKVYGSLDERDQNMIAKLDMLDFEDDMRR